MSSIPRMGAPGAPPASGPTPWTGPPPDSETALHQPDGRGASVEAAPPNPRQILQQGRDPGTGYSYERGTTADGAQYETFRADNGVVYNRAFRENQERFHVTIPQGLLPGPLEIVGGSDNGQPAQLVAYPSGHPEERMEVHLSQHGNLLIGLGGSMAMFDPKTLAIGLTSPKMNIQTPTGPAIYTALNERVNADNSRVIHAHEFITQQTMQSNANMMGFGAMWGGVNTAAQSYPQRNLVVIHDDNRGNVTAKQVVLRDVPPNQGGGMFNSAPASREEMPLRATRLADGSYSVKSGSLGDFIRTQWKNGPLRQWWLAQKNGSGVIKTFSSDPSLLATLSAAAGPGPAAASAATR